MLKAYAPANGPSEVRGGSDRAPQGQAGLDYRGEAAMGDSANQPPHDSADTVLSALLTQDAELWTTSEAFVRTLPARAEALLDALRSGSFERIRSVAHHLKAAGAHCGQRDLCDKAALVEQAAHDHAIDGLALRIHDLTALISRIHGDLRDDQA
ncbi:hypothetical protein RAS2_23500 [Phycisphaerae bacterium RAS2]|nr:hypothetical protein RAS2_23500 [Phycisphaerae bacterium RAS2]